MHENEDSPSNDIFNLLVFTLHKKKNIYWFKHFFMLQTHCSVNYDNWPWSEQNCTYTAGSWTHDIENINIKPSLDDLSKQENPLNFDLFNKNRVSFTKV